MPIAATSIASGPGSRVNNTRYLRYPSPRTAPASLSAQLPSPLERARASTLTAASVNTASCSEAFWTGIQADVFGIEGDGPVFQDIARNTYIANGLGLVKCRVRIPEIKELLEIPDMLTDIDNLKIGITFYLFLYILAVRASMHYIHLDHRITSCIRLW